VVDLQLNNIVIMLKKINFMMSNLIGKDKKRGLDNQTSLNYILLISLF
jgi:hypothetical protein